MDANKRERIVRAGPAIRGIVVIVVLVALAVGVDRFQKMQEGEISDGSVTAMQMVQAIASEEDLAFSESGVPEGFEDELFSVQGFREVQQVSDGSVVGMVSADSPSAVLDRYRSSMEGRGWTYMESGQNNRATFVKGQGRFSWSCIDCTEVGNSTSVVVLLERRG